MKLLVRLPKSAFAATYASGKVTRHPLLQVRVLRRNDGGETLGVAFAVGKKLGKATVRNTMRRRMRAAFAEEMRQASTRAANVSEIDSREENGVREYSREKLLLEKLRGANLIFLASPPALEADFPALRQAIAELLKRAASR